MESSPKYRSKPPMTGTTLSLLVIMLMTVHYSSGAKFLIGATSLVTMPSHYMGLTTITQALVERGHDVTLLILDRRGTAGFLPRSYTANITYPNPKTDEELQLIATMKSTGMAAFVNMSLIDHLRDDRIHKFLELFYFGCFELFKNEDVLEQLKREEIDMMISMPVTDLCDAVIAAYLNVPLVVLSGTRRAPVWHEGMIGIPVPLSYVPFSFSTVFTDNMTFMERVLNVVVANTLHPLMEYFLLHRPIGQLQALHDIRRDLTPGQIVSKADLWLCHSTWALEFPKPTAPSWIPIAGYTIKDPKPLPTNLAEFIEGSGDDGFIVFTLGSMTVNLNNEVITDMFSKVFSELPQRVVWRYNGPTPRYLGNNTLIADWLPQSDLLAHSKARLLIYHGGSAGVHEALNYGVPMLIMPLVGDQPMNGLLLEMKGLGIVIKLATVDEDVFRNAVSTLLHEASYQKNALKASAILRDRMASPLDTAVFWIEHVLKFGGDHLRLRSVEMGFIQLHSLDVVFFLFAAFLIWAYITYVLIAKCCGLCKRKGDKSKKD